MRSVAFIGSAGVPNRYGGFESFLEACAPVIATRRRTVVTCDAARYDDHATDWHGVERRFVRPGANGATSILHDLAAFARVWRDCDAIVVLGVSAGLFMPLLRLASAWRGNRLIVNVDGVEWRREKFSRGRKAFLWISDRLSQRFAHRVVIDSEALMPFLSPPGRAKAVYIAYSGDQVPRRQRNPGADYCLTICRIEPENNCELLIEGFLASGRPEYRFVGNWNGSEYGRALRQRYSSANGLKMIDSVYDPEVITDLRENAATYLHGHSVGGTNPSLVEMLYYDAPIMAFDCAFNIETAGDAAHYFQTPQALAALLRSPPEPLPQARDTARTRFTRAAIAAQYEQLIDE